MLNKALGLISTVALAAVASAGFHAPLDAQQPVRLAFGYQCDNRFVLRNEGTYGVEVGYHVVDTDEGGRVSIDAGQTVALEPQAMGDVEILVDDRVVATAENSGMTCAPNVVVVPRPSLFMEFLRAFASAPVWNGGGLDRDHDDYGDDRPPGGYNSGRPHSGARADRPQNGGGGHQQNGSAAGRPQNGNSAGRPQNGNSAGRPQKGGGSDKSRNDGRTAHPRNDDH